MRHTQWGYNETVDTYIGEYIYIYHRVVKISSNNHSYNH